MRFVSPAHSRGNGGSNERIVKYNSGIFFIVYYFDNMVDTMVKNEWLNG
jgi:hypothetical protein